MLYLDRVEHADWIPGLGFCLDPWSWILIPIEMMMSMSDVCGVWCDAEMIQDLV